MWVKNVCVTSVQVLAQLQAQQGGGSLPQHFKLQLPIQIQQTGTTSAQGGQVQWLVRNNIQNIPYIDHFLFSSQDAS